MGTAVPIGAVKAQRKDHTIHIRVSTHSVLVCAILELLNTHLDKQKFVAGDHFTMGDIPLGCVAYRYFNVDVMRPELPFLQAWYQRLSKRQAYQRHVMRFFGTNPTEWGELEKACRAEGIL